MRLEILTDDKQCAQVCEDYWRQNEEGKFALKVQEIATSHGMKPHIISKYVEQHAYVWAPTVCCVRCKQPYRFGTRAQYQGRNWHKGSVCKNCIKLEHQAIADEKRAILIRMRQSVESKKVDLETLDLKSSIFLLATIQALGDEHLSTIEPLLNYPACTLSPDLAYDQEILRHLVNKNLLLISLNTPQEALEIHVHDDGASINFRMSPFDLTLNQRQTKDLVREFFDGMTIKNIKQTQGFVELCREVQLNECIGFLKAMLKTHQLSLSPGEKTQQVLINCLENFSVAQVYNFIWRATRDAAAYYMRSSISKKQAANSVVGAIARNMEQALANSWEVKSFNRNYNLPQCWLSRIIFNMVLGTDDGGFKYTLHELLEQKNETH